MTIGDANILTPEEDASAYALDWRWQAAQALLRLEASGARATAPLDADVRRLARCSGKRAGTAKPTAFDRVVRWRENGVGAVAEAFVLACGSVEAAAAEMGVACEDVATYCRCFFDVFDAKGRMRVPALLRIRAGALAGEIDDPAQKIRTTALRLGLHGLKSLLGHEDPDYRAEKPTLDQLVEAELRRRLAAGELRTADLVRLQANAAARERAGGEPANGDGLGGLRLVQQILALTAPKLVKPDDEPERTRATDAAIRARFEAQKNIGATTLPHDDSAAAAEALNRMMAGNFNANDEQ